MAFASDKTRQGAAGVSTGYEIDNSLRFNDDDSAYLSRTPASASNRKTWTWSGWVKRGSNLNLDQDLFGVHDGSANITKVYFLADQKLQIEYYNGSTNYYIRTNQLFRDVSAWYHIVAIFDTTQSTEANRLQLWVNGERITSLSNDVQPTLNFDGWVNDTKEHSVGRRAGNNSEHLDGYLAEVNFIDGTAELPSAFGESGDYGEWKPIKYTGTYGTNGFYLSFAGGGIMSATGGTITTDGDYKVHSFTADGTFTPTSVPATDNYVDYLVIGGGGSGASNANAAGGGGGAGGYRTGMLPVTGDTGYSITVGDGGATTGTTATGNDGDASVFSTITSSGGGGGGYGAQNGHSSEGLGNGSGGGAGYNPATGASGGEFGNDGGDGGATGAGKKYGGGGGGGSSAVGGDGGDTTAGAGGAGSASSITGSSVTRAGGGGGGQVYGGTSGAGGSGGGGAGGATGSAGNAATANTGSGGGGGSGNASSPIGNYSGGAGGSGIVIIRYKFQ